MNRSLHAGSGETGIGLVAVHGEVLPPPGDEVDMTLGASALPRRRFLRNWPTAISDIPDSDERYLLAPNGNALAHL
jgi:hypothetical protein